MLQTVLDKIISAILSIILLLSGSSMSDYDYSDRLNETDYVGLREVYAEYFDIGTAIGSMTLQNETYAEAVLKNYSSLTGENAFKLAYIHPSKDVWNFGPADIIADFARKNGLKLRGHCLVWGSQENWMLYDDNGNSVSKDVFYQREYDYFKVMMGRYGDIIHTWDVVNEPFNYERGCDFKQNEIYKLCGEEYITKAFEFAHEIDPSAVLVLNETRVLKNDVKMDYLLEYAEKYKKAGVPINAIGLQSHYDTLSINENASRLDKLINKISALGYDIQITEMDMTVYSDDYTSYDDGPPLWVQTLQNKKYKEIFEVLRKNADKISSVTFWGMDDGHSSYNSKNLKRQDWPLVFDKNIKPKQAYYAICDF